MKKHALRHRIRLTARGFRLLEKYCPGLCSGKAFTALLDALQPFVSIYLGAQIVSEISGPCRPIWAASYAAAIILLHFIIQLLKSGVSRICDQKEAQMWTWFSKVFSDKQLHMDYAQLENAAIQRQRQKEEENLFTFGNGMAQLVWGTAGLVRAAVSIITSVAMVFSLFIHRAGHPAIDSPLWLLAIIGCMLLGAMLNSLLNGRENQIFEVWCEKSVWFNRAFHFFGSELGISLERARDVRIYEQYRPARRVFAELFRNERSGDDMLHRMAACPALATAVSGLCYGLCYAFVAAKAFLGAFGAGNIVQYAGALSRLSDGLQEMMYVLTDNAVYCRHLETLFAFLDLPTEMKSGTLVPPNDTPLFQFCRVSFRYPGSDEFALWDVNLTITPGQHMALVGMNGGGKSTFVKLLCRLYDPSEGQILLNGVDIREYDLAAYQRLFSVVFQDFKLFSFPLGENVAASEDFDESRVQSTLKKAGFSARLETLPQGLDTCLYRDFDGEGVEISGGEAQKIALARALYRDSPCMVLDEPTAALDPLAEQEVYARFHEVIGHKTAVYISHRLSSCRFCDEIAVFDGGRIVQRGNHDDLLSVPGLYRDMWQAQAQYYNT